MTIMTTEKAPIDKTYDPEAIEQHWYHFWESQNYFAPSGSGEPYCILLPPPNVTGSLHMGHGFGFTLTDILIRYQRMQGKNTLWQMGTDHAGIATQMVVERQLNQEGKTRSQLGREAFLQKIWEWKKESGGHISRQLKRLGASLDWASEKFTLDEDISHAVRDVFIRLYNEGLIYRGKKLVNWDPVLLTALSDLEVVNEESDGKLWYIRYPLAQSTEALIVATTRPETLFGDAAIAVHPKDQRYQHLIDQHVRLPLTDRLIPIIADEYVDPVFGTGCVKITPAHDFNDYAVGKRHHLTPINIFTPTAHLNENVPLQFQGLERFQARKKILYELQTAHLIEKTEAHQLKIPRGEKSGSIIEPYLTSQWFMRMKPLSTPAIAAVDKGEITFIPENWKKTYAQWMHHIEDWCISRQLWWGHRIPVWYDQNQKIYVGQDEKQVRADNQLSKETLLTQESDVLDTWFSSALWPFAALGWPINTDRVETFYPTQLLSTGFDIIFFWVARMIMMGLKFTGKVPFKEVYITGLIRDADGKKMSKSKGNVLDPIDLIDGISLPALIQKRTYGLMQPDMAQKIEKSTRKEFPDGLPGYGTDALRFTFCSLASYTREIRFDTHRLAGYRNFCNKLWNAARYVLMNTEGKEISSVENVTEELSVADRWIFTKLQFAIEEARHELSPTLYRFDLFAKILYDFTWNEFCDWYVELSKPILTATDQSKIALRSTRYTLVTVLETLLRLLHPIVPFITEEIWQRIAPLTQNKKTPTIMLAAYPTSNKKLIFENALHEINWLKSIVIAVRTIRSEMNISPGKHLPILLRKGTEEDRIFFASQHLLLNALAKTTSITWISDGDTPPPAASIFVGKLEIYLPLSGFIDPEEEIARLTREQLKLNKELSAIENKLQNPQFIQNAPANVIQKEKNRQAELTHILTKLNVSLNEMHLLLKKSK